jgi:hypothetical protein
MMRFASILRKRHRNDHGNEIGMGRVGSQGCPTLLTIDFTILNGMHAVVRAARLRRGPGSVLRSLTMSQRVPVTTLRG